MRNSALVTSCSSIQKASSFTRWAGRSFGIDLESLVPMVNSPAGIHFISGGVSARSSPADDPIAKQNAKHAAATRRLDVDKSNEATKAFSGPVNRLFVIVRPFPLNQVITLPMSPPRTSPARESAAFR